jgi:GTPase Era involved in 16S rRNA processing
MKVLLSAVAKSVIANSLIAKSVIVMSAALITTEASAQLVNLTGRYVCVAVCTPGLQGQFAFITQNGTELSQFDRGTVWQRAPEVVPPPPPPRRR